MKQSIITILFLLLCLSTKAQEAEIAIAVGLPAESTIDSNTRAFLKNKLLRMVTAQGFSGTECGAILIVPSINTTKENTVEGGMRRIYTKEIDITISVINIFTNTVFGTTLASTSGEGYSEKEAIQTAINKLNLSAPQYTQFVATAKQRILDYYKSNTSAIVVKANTLAAQQQYEEALAMLSYYPEALPGYSTVSATIIKIFKQCQTQYCRQILQSARAAYSSRNYEEAIALAAMVDAQSTCAAEAKSLLAAIKRDNDKQYNDAIALEREARRSSERLRKAEINAIRDIAKAYYSQQTAYILLY